MSIVEGVSRRRLIVWLVLVRDEAAWRAWAGVSDDKVPWVVLLDAAGNARWRVHGAAKELEPQLRAAAH